MGSTKKLGRHQLFALHELVMDSPIPLSLKHLSLRFSRFGSESRNAINQPGSVANQATSSLVARGLATRIIRDGKQSFLVTERGKLAWANEKCDSLTDPDHPYHKKERQCDGSVQP